MLINPMVKDHRIFLFGDEYGLPQLLEVLPRKQIVGVSIASIRMGRQQGLLADLQSNGLEVLIQPTLKKESRLRGYMEALRDLGPTIGICCSYSQILSESLLSEFEEGVFNIHAALLPKNRGPNPIQWAIIKGEDRTGISLHRVVKDIDAGPILAQVELPIGQDKTWVDVKRDIDRKTPQFLQESLPQLLRGELSESEQNEFEVTVNKRLTADSPQIDFDKMNDEQIFNLIRAQVSPLSGAYYIHNGDKVRISEYQSLTQVQQLRKDLGFG